MSSPEDSRGCQQRPSRGNPAECDPAHRYVRVRVSVEVSEGEIFVQVLLDCVSLYFGWLREC